MTNRLEQLVLTGALAGSLIFGSGKAIAQNYEPCDINNPNYCTECRDESKRDFAKCGEIDYRNIKLVESDRLGPVVRPDYDPFLERVIFSVDVSKDRTGKNSKYEIFLLDSKGQKRLSWNASYPISNIAPYWTGNRKIAYTQFDNETQKGSKEKYKYNILDTDGKKIREISEGEYTQLYKESHQGEHPNVLSVPPSK